MSSFASFQNEIEQYSQRNLKAGYTKEPSLANKLSKATIGKQVESSENPQGNGKAVHSIEVSEDGRTILVRLNALF